MEVEKYEANRMAFLLEILGDLNSHLEQLYKLKLIVMKGEAHTII